MPKDALTIDDLVIRSSSYTPFFGIYLAAHAISDSLCMCHASVGCKVKTQRHLVRHDGIRSAHRRMRYSQFIDEDLISGSTEQLEDEIGAWQRRQDSQVVLIDPSTPINLQGQDFASLTARLEEKLGVNVVFVDARNYDRDFYSGYASAIGALLGSLDFAATPREDEVSLIGYPFDRYEADNHANVSELRRLIRLLGFNAPAVFLAGEPFAQLQLAGRAHCHLLTPYAHSQAKVLRRLKQPHHRVGWPMSVAGTVRWLTQIADLLGVSSKRLEAAIQREMERVKPLLELMRDKLRGRGFAVFADAPRAAGVVSTLMEAGMVPRHISVLHFDLGGRERVEETLASEYDIALPEGVTWQENATPEEIQRFQIRDCSLIVGTSIERELVQAPRSAWLELGFPSCNQHYVFPSPYLGFSGAMKLLEQASHIVENSRPQDRRD